MGHMGRFKREDNFGKRSSGRSDRGESSRFSGRESSRDRSAGRGSDRFEERGGRGHDRFSGRSSERSERSNFDKPMHRVVCDKCGETCEVPFKPTSGKPVYCSDCFRKNEYSESRSKSSSSSRELEEINLKLDKILKAMNIN